MPNYFLCGWHVHSDKPLPLISALQTASNQAGPDIHITHGPVPPINQPTLFSSPFITIYANGDAVVRIGTSLSILVSAGKQVIIDAAAETTQGEIMTFLLGPALGLLCHQRQVLPLHGASIRIGNAAITLVGQSGSGKSTSATALINRGHQLLCDDITVVDSAQATVFPSYPAVKLWQDAAHSLAIKTDNLSKVRTGLQKFHYPVESSFDSLPAKLQSIIILAPRMHIASAEVMPLNKIHALAQLRPHIYRRRLSQLVGTEQTYFKQLGDLVSKIPVIVIKRPDNLAHLESVIDLIEKVVLS